MLLVLIDTSSTTEEWALVELVKNPKIVKKAQDELDHVVGHEHIVVEEDIFQVVMK